MAEELEKDLTKYVKIHKQYKQRIKWFTSLENRNCIVINLQKSNENKIIHLFGLIKVIVFYYLN